MIRRWEALRAPEVAKWQKKYRVEWGRHGLSKRRSSTKSMGNIGWRWRVSMVEQRRKLKVRSPWCWTWHVSGSPSGVGLGNALQLPEEDLAWCRAGGSSTRGVYSSKDVRRSRSRPSRPSCQDPSGVVCFCVLFCKMR